MSENETFEHEEQKNIDEAMKTIYTGSIYVPCFGKQVSTKRSLNENI